MPKSSDAHQAQALWQDPHACMTKWPNPYGATTKRCMTSSAFAVLQFYCQLQRRTTCKHVQPARLEVKCKVERPVSDVHLKVVYNSMGGRLETRLYHTGGCKHVSPARLQAAESRLKTYVS